MTLGSVTNYFSNLNKFFWTFIKQGNSRASVNKFETLFVNYVLKYHKPYFRNIKNGNFKSYD